MTACSTNNLSGVRPWLVDALLCSAVAAMLVHLALPLHNLATSTHALLRYGSAATDRPAASDALRLLESAGWLLAGLTLMGGAALALLHYWHRPTEDVPWLRSTIWPVFMLLSGISVLWIAGFAATGPLSPRNGAAGARYMGLAQMQGVYLACAVVLLTARFGHSLLAKGIRLGAHISQSGAWYGAIGMGLVLLGILVWVGHPKNALLPVMPLRGLGMPHLSSEALRLLALLGLAWGFYRYGDLPSSRTRWRRGVLACTALVAAGWSALVATGDRGPLQVAALHMALVLLSGLALLGAPAQPALHRMALTALALMGTLVVFWWGQTQLAPRVSTTAAERAWARVAPELASSSNYMQTLWLLDAASPPGSAVPRGFGLGKVPYCGARAWLGVGSCTLTSGSPIQLPSDFPVVGLIATFGLWPTAALVGLLLLWLRLMARGACAGNRTNPVDRLRAWLVSLLALSLGIQTLLSVAGGLGWSLLTGITLPLLGYGQTSLQVLALAAGLALAPKNSALSNRRL